MTTKSLIELFASDPETEPLLREPELVALAKRPPDTLVNAADLTQILSLCERMEEAVEADVAHLQKYAEELETLG